MHIPTLPLAALFLASLAAATRQQHLSTTNAGWQYVDCGLETDAFHLKSLTVSPDPPVPGKNLTVTVTGDVLQPIQDGAYADITVKLGLIKLIQKTFDVCEEARNANVSVRCPVAKGTYEVKHTVKLPNEIPRAKFTVAVRGYTADDGDMVCLDLFIDFMKGPFLKAVGF
ncbi:ML domain-containing protein [Mycena rosella]|uniref:Phosphatidylglycerol/phosphatidylinositol transfer protein n=1 Tax=Mycena rosella TaxID=1033263 RepID=A0AAD7G4M8_MYCRO|nr:ML domain-containing protein [Mycena rosella]